MIIPIPRPAIQSQKNIRIKIDIDVFLDKLIPYEGKVREILISRTRIKFVKSDGTTDIFPLDSFEKKEVEEYECHNPLWMKPFAPKILPPNWKEFPVEKGNKKQDKEKRKKTKEKRKKTKAIQPSRVV